MEQIIIEAKRSRAMITTAVALLMLLASTTLYIVGLKENKKFCITIGFLLMLGFGIFFLISLMKALESKPLLTITFDGVYDNSSVGSVVYFAYQDIKEFCIVNLTGKQVIGIIPKDELSFINKLSPVRQGTARTNLNMSCPPIYIRADRARDISAEDIFTLLKKRLDDYSCLYD